MPDPGWIPDDDGDAQTWRCHVCGRERPDQDIAVWEHGRLMERVPFSEFVRFCRDDPDCLVKAKAFHFIPLRADEREVASDA